jgi:hypothetical protein
MLSQKSPFTSRISPPDASVRIGRAISQRLFDVGIHTAAGLPAAYRTDDEDAGVQALLRNLQPTWMFGALDAGGVMHLAEDK